MLEITAGGFDFRARFEEKAAPETVAAFRRMLPLQSKIITVRWSGGGGWTPTGGGGAAQPRGRRPGHRLQGDIARQRRAAVRASTASSMSSGLDSSSGE